MNTIIVAYKISNNPIDRLHPILQLICSSLPMDKIVNFVLYFFETFPTPIKQIHASEGKDYFPDSSSESHEKVLRCFTYFSRVSQKLHFLCFYNNNSNIRIAQNLNLSIPLKPIRFHIIKEISPLIHFNSFYFSFNPLLLSLVFFSRVRNSQLAEEMGEDS